MTNDIFYIDWCVGAHVAFSSDIFSSVSYGISMGMHNIQIFMGNPMSAWKREKISKKDIDETKILITRFPMNIFSHYPYCANLAGQSCVNGLAWSGNSTIDNKLSGILKQLEYELSIISSFRINQNRCGVVIHPGSYPDRFAGHKTVAKTINHLNFPKNSVLILENCAGEGNKLCRTFDEIDLVLKNLNKDSKNHVKICIDTAHIWGQGDYDLREISEIDRMFSEFDQKIGLDLFYLLHLNDSSVPFGSKKDVHARLGFGHIWSESFLSLVHLVKKCTLHGIPMILETSCSDMLTLGELNRQFS